MVDVVAGVVTVRCEWTVVLVVGVAGVSTTAVHEVNTESPIATTHTGMNFLM
ncbi:hypothetical protein BH18VER1_BH18VER1_10060 [soil metagenome]